MAEEEQLHAQLSAGLATLRQQIVELEALTTKLKQLEEALRASAQRYRLWFNSAHDAIFVAHTTTEGVPGSFIDVNDAACHTLGYTRDELLQLSAFHVLPSEQLESVAALMKQLLVDEHVLFETVHVTKNGTHIPVEVSSRLFKCNGRPTILSVARDISLRKHQEQQRADFLAMLTHDIRNPLGVILGYTEMLLEDAQERGTAETEKYLEHLKSNVLTLHALVTNYLDLSQIEAGQLTLTQRPVAINSLLRQVEQQYEIEARRRRIRVRLRLQDDLSPVTGDALALERVFANLLNNALKFTPSRGRVTIRSFQLGNEVMVSVTDTGPGIAPAELPTLFQKYRRVTAWSQEGVGLGLFIVKTLIDAHKGRVEVESVPGQGTRFTVLLPIGSAEPQE
jgi:PAS domain S-box-containing protein